MTAQAPVEAPPAPPCRPTRRGGPAGLVVAVGYLLASFGLYRGLWAAPGTGYLRDSGRDQALFEWFFAVHADALAQGKLILFSALQNHPDGVNLMGNTSMPGLAVPLAPLTWLCGPTATWAVVLTFGLAGTALCWYLLFARHLVGSRWAAAVGGGFCAFAPPVVSHAFAHPNFTATFLLPLIIGQLVRLTRAPDRRATLRHGMLLGLLVAWQVLIGEEPLLILATGLGVYGLAWAFARPATLRSALRPLATGLGVGAAVAVTLVGYPLWVQFTGPASYRSLRHGPAGNDLSTFTALPRQSLGGHLVHPGQAVPNPTEQNAYFGWALLVLAVAAAVWLWSLVPARLAAVTATAGLVLSAGNPVFLHGQALPVPGPWLLLDRLPLYESMLEARLTFFVVPAIGMLLALGTDRALAADPGRVRPGYPARVPAVDTGVRRGIWFAGLAVALLPVLPTPFSVVPRPATPELFTSGEWRELVRPGRSVVPAPPPDALDAAPLSWQVDAGLAFPIAEGYFVGPDGPARSGRYGAPRRPTSRLLADAARSGSVPPVGPAERAGARADLRAWRADLVVLAPRPNDAAVRITLDELIGPGQERGGVVVWDVRELTD
ncbi:MAG: glycosyl transferase [Pseudonocardia sp.]